MGITCHCEQRPVAGLELLVVARPAIGSRPLYYSDGLAGRSGNWVDGTALRRTGADLQDEIRHLAKVRVAGSNPVFRSRSGAVFDSVGVD